MGRRRSRRRKSSYRGGDETAATEARIDDLSPRAKRLVESGVIDLATIAGSGEEGRITSGDILHAARVIEMEHSVARIETVDRSDVTDPAASEEMDIPDSPVGEPTNATESDRPADLDSIPPEDIAPPVFFIPEASESTMSSAADLGGDPIETSQDTWDAYRGSSSEGLSESAMSGADLSWGEAEANIAAIAEEAAAQLYGRSPSGDEVSAATASEVIEEMAEIADTGFSPSESVGAGAYPIDETAGAAESTPSSGDPTVVVDSAEEVEALTDEPESDEEWEGVTQDEPGESKPPADVQPTSAAGHDQGLADMLALQPEATLEQQAEIVMDFGTLELVDPVSVWEEGAEDFAPWFLAHSKQLGDVLGLEAGLSDARQFATRSASGVLGSDDNGDDVVVVSSEQAVATDSDLGRALSMAASSGAATVALVSARFEEEQLQAIAWLNNQTTSGVKWYAIELRVVRIADSPAAMLFDRVAAPNLE